MLPNQEGGLLGWLGEIEDKVDKLEVDYPHKEKLTELAHDYVKLPELAQQLSWVIDPYKVTSTVTES